MSDNFTLIIDNLIKQRKSKGWTQTDLAKAANLTQSVIARIECKRATPKLSTLIRIILALDCRLEIVPGILRKLSPSARFWAGGDSFYAG